jgi:hypothetical protein
MPLVRFFGSGKIPAARFDLRRHGIRDLFIILSQKHAIVNTEFSFCRTKKRKVPRSFGADFSFY